MNKIIVTYIFISCFLIGGIQSLHSQTADTVRKAKIDKKALYGRARTAAIMSAVFPGLGQIYNRKYWKAPIVYASLAGFGYLLISNQIQFDYYSTNLRNENDNDPATKNETIYNSDQLYTLKTEYRKGRDAGIIGCLITYFVNIVDANVDAHLKTFDVSDNLSLRIKPYNNVSLIGAGELSMQNGISIQLNFK